MATLREMIQYIKDFHTTGVTWNPKVSTDQFQDIRHFRFQILTKNDSVMVLFRGFVFVNFLQFIADQFQILWVVLFQRPYRSAAKRPLDIKTIKVPLLRH